MIPPSTAEQGVISQPLPGLAKQAQTNCETVLSTNNTRVLFHHRHRFNNQSLVFHLLVL